jgi:hypothetical protein
MAPSCEDEAGRRTTGKLLTRDEARRIAGQAAGAVARAAAEKRGVTRLRLHTSRQSVQCPLRPQFQKYRRNALSDVRAFNRLMHGKKAMCSALNRDDDADRVSAVHVRVDFHA